MPPPRPYVHLLGLAAAAGCVLPALAEEAAPAESGAPAPVELSATARLNGDIRRANASGVLAPANALLGAGLSRGRLELEVRAKAPRSVLVATARHVHDSRGRDDTSGFVNELYTEQAAGSWHFTLGKKIVSWDVGYAYRPLDVIQQENRRAFNSGTLEGVPVLLAERFHADGALTLVAANPGRGGSRRGQQSPAWAARLYQRFGSTDTYAVLRYTEQQRLEGGAAVAAVISDTLELHASGLLIERAEIAQLQTAAARRSAGRVLVGASWTGENKLSLLAEAWYDGTAPSRQDWDHWRAAGVEIRRSEALGMPVPAVAGRLAGHASLLPAGGPHRRNLLARASYSGESWSMSADLLLTPADRGYVASAALGWSGDRWRWETGLRVYGGPATAAFRQMPDRTQAYLAATVAF